MRRSSHGVMGAGISNFGFILSPVGEAVREWGGPGARRRGRLHHRDAQSWRFTPHPLPLVSLRSPRGKALSRKGRGGDCGGRFVTRRDGGLWRAHCHMGRGGGWGERLVPELVIAGLVQVIHDVLARQLCLRMVSPSRNVEGGCRPEASQKASTAPALRAPEVAMRSDQLVLDLRERTVDLDLLLA